MQWEVTGSNRDTGEEIAYLIEAENEASATRRGNRAGLMVSSVRLLDPDDTVANQAMQESTPVESEPEPAEVASDPLEELSGMLPPSNWQPRRRPSGPPCPFCGSRRIPIRQEKGSGCLAMLLILFFILPGIIYAIWGRGYQLVCPNCGGVRGAAS